MSGSGKKKQWLPLESNPEVMNKYLDKLGARGDLLFYDVFGIDPELLMMVPQPAQAIVVLFPITELSEAHKKEEDALIKEKGQTVSPDVYFTKQTVGNACGTVGIIHTILNLRQFFHFDEDKFFHKFYNATKDMTPMERAKALEENTDIEVAHEAAAASGDSKQPASLDEVNLHFFSLVNVGNTIYELDGRKSFPINHGPTSPETFVSDAVAVVRKFMERDPTNLNFSMCALAPSS
eukprot:TRINITY_DN736_c0_g1_i1.p1 TRINITY_DN736_c0_g1~~TRINITY_DN736_c0_g1_i1.p1  ORF type:complete len:236 (+),score=88.03 TRINITY_DN736_c0_g1_i1:38-745(+)